MRRGRRRDILRAAVLALSLVLPARPALAGEPWYRDVPHRHWAYPYIRVLWEEEVTDGYDWRQWLGSPGPRAAIHDYYPDRTITLAEFTLMTGKAFRLSPVTGAQPYFKDVPPTLELYGWIPALPWIEAARLAGIVHGAPGGFLHPDRPTERQQAVAMLVRSLGLAPFAASLSDQEAALHLKTFRDWSQIDRSLFKELALAVKLRIVIGYPDGTLKPSAGLTRAEAATVLYRSALFTLTAAPNPFSPDGDGTDDATAFRTRTLKNRNAVRWQAYVGTAGGRVFRTFNPGDTGVPPSSFPWDGRDDPGRFLAPGIYYYWGWIEDRQGQRFEAVRKPIILEHKTLRGTAAPSVVAPGDPLRIRADTTGRAWRVSALWPDGGALPLTPVGSPGDDVNRWRLDWRVPPDAVEGDRTLLLRADYEDGANRQVTVSYRVGSPLPPSESGANPLEDVQFILTD